MVVRGRGEPSNSMISYPNYAIPLSLPSWHVILVAHSSDLSTREPCCIENASENNLIVSLTRWLVCFHFLEVF